jgi:osmotically-inducible protein OsmY
MFAWVRQARAALMLAIALDLLACSTPGNRTEAERAADRSIVDKVQTALRNAPYLDAEHIDVDANRGVVRLSGQVGTDSDLRGALRIATAVPGVLRVDDQLEIIDFGRSSHR